MVKNPINSAKKKVSVRQGDPISPTLFNIFIEPLLKYLNNSKHGYEFETLDKKPIQQAVINFADDQTLMGPSLHDTKKLFNRTEVYLHHHSMELNYKKCLLVSNDPKYKSNQLKSII